MAYTYQKTYAHTLEYFKGDRLATETWVNKYALKNNKGTYDELTPDDMHWRMAKEFARMEDKYPHPMSEQEIYGLFKDFKYVVPQGSPMSAIGNPYRVQSAGNCFVLSAPYDSYGGICYNDQQQVQIMKRRGGVGFDISTLRPKGQTTDNAALTTDGIGVFMERYSNSTREVAQGGRRGALMLSLSIHHPEVRTFIKIKQDKSKVTGANVSVRLSDEFMEAVDKGEKFQLRWPVDERENPQMEEWVDARELWDDIIYCAWDSAEPGLLFWDNIIKNSPADCYADVDEAFRTVSTNPCIVGSTKIAVADGRNAVPIAQLAKEGRDVLVYSTDPSTGQVQIKTGRNPRRTGDKKEVWKLTLDDGSCLVATPDHKIMLSDCSYMSLKDLQPGDSVFPFYAFESNRYRQIANVGAKMLGGRYRNRRQYRLIHEFYHGEVNPKTHAIHHVDLDSTNDSPDNLQTMLHEEHKRLHADRMMGDANPYHRMSDGWKKQFASHPGESNGRYSGHTNEQLLEHGRILFEQNGKLEKREWIRYAKENGLPQQLANDFRFGSFSNFVNQVANNHKVVSVEFAGYEDVYNITVDDNHNYHVITSGDFVASGLCIKNCGEVPMGCDSCRLLLVNLLSFVRKPFTKQATFDWDHYGEVVQKAQRLMDDLVDLEIEIIGKIIAKIDNDPEPDRVKAIERDTWEEFRRTCELGRRTGLGITALGDTLAALGVKYGSGDSIEVVEDIYRRLCLDAYRSSCYMAKERNPFPLHDHSKETDSTYLQRIWNADKKILEMSKKYGRRNVALTTTAPAGSVSILTQTTNGVEPLFLTRYTRRRKLNTFETIEPDFVDRLGDRWVEYDVVHRPWVKWQEASGKKDIEQSPYWKATANDIDWVNKIKLQAAAQKWICHALSNTTNVPKQTTMDTIKAIYLEGWKSGCKGVTVYRDGCRTGVLISQEDDGSMVRSFVFVLEDGSCLQVQDNEEIEYNGGIYRAAELFQMIHAA